MSGIPACRVKNVYSFSLLPCTYSSRRFRRAEALHTHHVWSAYLCREDIPGPLGLRDLLWPHRHSCAHDHSQMGETEREERTIADAAHELRNVVSCDKSCKKVAENENEITGDCISNISRTPRFQQQR